MSSKRVILCISYAVGEREEIMNGELIMKHAA